MTDDNNRCPRCKKIILESNTIGNRVNAIMSRLMEGDVLSTDEINSLVGEGKVKIDLELCRCPPTFHSINWGEILIAN